MTFCSLIAISVLIFLLGTFYRSFFAGWIAGILVYILGSYLLLEIPLNDCGNWVLIGLTILFSLPPLRRNIFSRFIMKIMAKVLPQIGETERIALEAGTVWWDRDLFSGNPQWKKMLSFPIHPLTNEEQMFLDGPVQKLCAMADDWKIYQSWDLPENIWAFLKEHRFFGIIIPKKYGGLGFSAQAHSEIVTKLGTRSSSVAVTVMVPNSLGPAELLLHYGTEDQKNYYLPRLARGEEIPCFALTEPQAGSDAASIKSTGVVCNGIFEGKPTVGIRLNWEKRWITLAPIATILGMAFQLKDPDRLLGGEEDVGITCALIPANLEGIETGKRHYTLHGAFQNGPTYGKDVFIPLSFIIGGQKMAGQGWRMLMECLAAGRSISLPGMAVGNSKVVARTIAAHSKIREQFNMPIGKFEGVEEKIANIAGYLYLMDAGRKLTAAAVDSGEKPSVVSAIMKAYTTEIGRQLVNDAMDIRAGAGISMGPKNNMASIYITAPISITVEGANILTRTLIVFGQGAIRCHPFVQKEIHAIGTKNVADFDKAFFGHMGHVARNKIRTILLGLTAGGMACVCVKGPQRKILRRFTQISSAYAFLTDTLMAVMGGSLKRREKISGRLADILAWLYLGTACIKRFQDDGNRKEDIPFLQWTTSLCLYNIQKAFYGLFLNIRPAPLGWILKVMTFPYGAPFREPTDDLGHKISQALLENETMKNRLTEGMYIPREPEEGLGYLESTLEMMRATESSIQKIKVAVSKKILNKHDENLFQSAVDKKIIDASEKAKLDATAKMKRKAVDVDEFEKDFFKNPNV